MEPEEDRKVSLFLFFGLVSELEGEEESVLSFKASCSSLKLLFALVLLLPESLSRLLELLRNPPKRRVPVSVFFPPEGLNPVVVEGELLGVVLLDGVEGLLLGLLDGDVAFSSEMNQNLAKIKSLPLQDLLIWKVPRRGFSSVTVLLGEEAMKKEPCLSFGLSSSEEGIATGCVLVESSFVVEEEEETG